MPRSKLPIFFVFSFFAFVPTVFGDPLLGFSRQVAPLRIDAAYGMRGPVAAATNGDVSLVAWHDENAHKVLFGLLRIDGSPITAVPRDLGDPPDVIFGWKTVAAASDARDFVVAWISRLSDGTVGIRVASIRSDGHINAIREVHAMEPMHLALGWNGTRYLLAYHRFSSNPGIATVLLSRDGIPEGAEVRQLGSFAITPSVASAEGDFLIVYRSSDVYALHLTGGGEWIAPPVRVSSGLGARDNAVASDGTDYIATWSEATADGTRLYARRITHDGAVGQSAAISDDTSNAGSPSIAWDGSSYIVTYLRTDRTNTGSPAEYIAARLTPELQLESQETLDRFDSTYMWPDIAGSGGTVVSAWPHTDPSHESSYSKYQSVLASVLHRGGLTSAPVTVSTGAAQEETVALASNASGTLLAWVERFGRTQERRVLAQFESRSGADPVRPYDSLEEQTAPAVAASAKDFLIAWVQHGNSGPVLMCRRFDVAGSPLDAEPLTITGDVAPESTIAAMWSGNRYAVAFENSAGRIQLALLDTDGIKIVQVSPARAIYRDHRPLLAFDGLQYLVVWIDDQPNDCPFECPVASDVRAARVTREGQVLDVDPPRAFSKILGQAIPSVVWDGQNFVLARGDYPYRITARRLRRDGTFIDPITGITLTNECTGPIDLRFDGTAFTLAGTMYNYPDSRGARVLVKTFSRLEEAFDTPFVVIDTTATAIALSTPAAGRFVLAQTARESDAPFFGATRVLVSTGTTSAPGLLTPPSGVWAFSSGSNVMIQWQDTSEDESGFAIEDRKLSGFVEVAHAAANQAVVYLTGVAAGDHYYRVVALRNGARSESSNSVARSVKPRLHAVRR